MKIAFIAAVNDASVFSENLQQSPDVASYVIYPIEGYSSAGMAYNAALDSSTEDILIFLHQDIYLPPGWMNQVLSQIKSLNRSDPNWAVLGVVGVDLEGRVVGRVYSSGLRRIVGRKLERPVQVQTLDEIVLILRRDTNVRFDPDLPGFHLYGSDLCQTALADGYSCYVIDAFCVHNSNGIRMLPVCFWEAYRYLAQKWAGRCPISTPCTKVSPRFVIQLRQRWADLRRHLLRRTQPGKRVVDPVKLYLEITGDL
jgi:glycosyltransferase involved in cell wall biosynthesis